MTKTTAALIFLFLIASLFLASYLGYFKTLTNLLNPNSEPANTTPGLYMQVTSHLENWNEISTNHPAAEYIVTIEVKNVDINQSTVTTIDFEIRSGIEVVKKGVIDVGIIGEDEAKYKLFKFKCNLWEDAVF